MSSQAHPEQREADRRNVGRGERHFQSVLMFIVLGVLSYVGYVATLLPTELGKITTQVHQMQGDLQRVERKVDQQSDQMRDYVTRTELNRETQLLERNDARLEQLIKDAEARRR